MAQQQPQYPTPTLYKCSVCSKQYDKQAYNDHMICQYKCNELIERVYTEARQENVLLRSKIQEIGEHVNQRQADKDIQIETWKSRLEKALQEIRNCRVQAETHEREKAVLLERQNTRLVETTTLQKEMERLKAEHHESILKLQNKQTMDTDRLNSEWMRRMEKSQSEFETYRTELENESLSQRTFWEERLRKERNELESQWTVKCKAITDQHATQLMDVETLSRKTIKRKDDELKDADALTKRLQQEATAYRNKVKDLTDRIHTLELALIEVKQEEANQKHDIKASFTKQIDDLHAKLKTFSLQNSTLQESLSMEQQKHVDAQQEWTTERKHYQSQLIQCRSKHLGQESLYSELSRKLDVIVGLLKDSERTSPPDPARLHESE
jgi:hypothetical protein